MSQFDLKLKSSCNWDMKLGLYLGIIYVLCAERCLGGVYACNLGH
jgi:hypothetical protein